MREAKDEHASVPSPRVVRLAEQARLPLEHDLEGVTDPLGYLGGHLQQFPGTTTAMMHQHQA